MTLYHTINGVDMLPFHSDWFNAWCFDDKIDSLYHKVNSDDFIDAIDNYNSILKDSLVEIIRDNCK